MAGEYRGREDTFTVFEREFQLTGGTYRPQLHDVLANDDHTVALLHVTASREGKELDMDYALVFHIRDDKITEGWVLTADPKMYDEFWA
nr:nuclear transport factor 2 family protein [Streptomyces tailanensis]